MTKLLATLITAVLLVPIGSVAPNPHFTSAASADRYSTDEVAPESYVTWGGGVEQDFTSQISSQ